MAKKQAKVEVKSSTGRKLGRGKYIKDVDVYVVETPTGIISTKNPEEKPETVPENGKVIKVKTPKFLMDNGKTLYGCQVWWQYV